MEIIAKILIALVAVEHLYILYILYIEMFAWETLGKKTFKTLPEELFKPTKGLAANQGLIMGSYRLVFFGHYSYQSLVGRVILRYFFWLV